MPSIGTFYSFDIGSSALDASQIGQDVTGNNISNANTAGYSLESVNLQEGDPSYDNSVASPTTPGQIGSGVSSGSIQRASDAFLTVQVNNSNSQQSSLSAQQNWLNQIQSAFNEPSNNTINTTLGAFFGAFASVENNPQDNGVKASAIQAGAAAAQMIQGAQQSLNSANTQITAQLKNDLSTVNNLGTQIAQLNVAIQQLTAQGASPNQLMDQRDLLISQVSGLANITTSTDANGSINVSIGATSLVQGVSSNTVSLSALQSNGDLQSGEMAGLTTTQTNLKGYQTNLDQLASQLITSVNQIHSQGTASDGTTGLNFFTGTNASNIAVNSVLLNNPQKLAVAGATNPPGTTPAPGDSSTATAIAALATATMTTGPLTGQTMQGFYTTMVTAIGADGSSVNTNLTTAQAAKTQLVNQQQSIVGVNQDDELTKMIEYQRMYQAATKIITTQSSMLDSLISMVPSS